MLTIRLHFPWGRYYAHPWGQNPVRITEAEWPPSPWRLLRTIAAAWFRKNPGQHASRDLLGLLQTLGRELPAMQLPAVSFSKTVQYHPNPGVPSGKVRHENHFVAVGGDVLFQWTLNDIPAEDRLETGTRMKAFLDELVAEIGYFGRAESVCDVCVTAGTKEIDPSTCARVVMNDGRPGRRIATDCRDVFCPNPDGFRPTDLWERRNGDTNPSLAPKHLIQDLLDTPQPLPDGAAWYSYQMPIGWPERWIVRHARPAKTCFDKSRVIARFLEFSLQCRIPVPTKHVVSIAGMFRDAALRNHGKSSFALSGHDRPDDIEGDHMHAFYLSIPEPSGHYLEFLRVWCQHGFTQREVNALMSVQALRWAGGRFPVRPVLLNVSRELPPVRSSRCWQSLTPFVPPRFWYRKKVQEGRIREQDGPELQLFRCLADNDGPTECIVSRVNGSRVSAWDVCKVHLPKSTCQARSEPDHRIGLFLQLAFAQPVALPLPALGHSCHFGLGQFVPMESS